MKRNSPLPFSTLMRSNLSGSNSCAFSFSSIMRSVFCMAWEVSSSGNSWAGRVTSVFLLVTGFVSFWFWFVVIGIREWLFLLLFDPQAESGLDVQNGGQGWMQELA